MMDHPSIAKVLDAGATDSGRPYFVMELVKGVPITRYCDEQRLTLDERLRLFLQVCQAVQHAHQKGVIHRDLKPSNVLVALYDDRPVPKVIDFGVAKAAGATLTERTMFTGLGAVVGTLEYMSPEQAHLNQLDVDTRSDVYALGVLLYELLTGSTPLTAARSKNEALPEALRIIREEEPPKPSTRLSTSQQSPTISANRRLEPGKLTGLVRGELDWIVMKAMEKDRDRRYDTANGLGRDVERYLSNEPVLACPPSARYQVRKFLRRHKAFVLAASLVLLVLIGGVAGTAWQAVRAGRERGSAAAEARNAKAEAAISQAVIEFIDKDLLARADPFNEPDRDLTLRAVVDRASSRIEGGFKGPPLVEATIRHTLGNTYLSLGEYARAEKHLLRAVDLRRTEGGSEHPRTLDSMQSLARVYSGQSRRAEAEALYGTVLDARQRVLGEEHPDTLSSTHDAAASHANLGRLDEAERSYRAVIDARARVLGTEHPDTLASTSSLALVYFQRRQYAEAEHLQRRALAGLRRGAGDRGRTGHALTATGSREPRAAVPGVLRAGVAVEEPAEMLSNAFRHPRTPRPAASGIT